LFVCLFVCLSVCDLFVYLFVCLLVCLFIYLFVCTLYKSTFPNRSQPNSAHISPLGLEEAVGYVWSENVCFFYLFDLLRRERVQKLGHSMAAGARHFRHSVISVILVGVSVTSRCCRLHFPRVIRDSVISVILACVSVTSRK
jgi:hypothetical protein